MDVHVPCAITTQLLRGVDVLAAQENGASELEGSKLLDRALLLGRVLVTIPATYRKGSDRQRCLTRLTGEAMRLVCCLVVSPDF